MALALSAALLALIPGPDAYAALARLSEAGSAPAISLSEAPLAPVQPGLPAESAFSPDLPVLSVPAAAPIELPAAQPSAATAQPGAQTAAQAAPAAQAAAAESTAAQALPVAAPAPAQAGAAPARSFSQISRAAAAPLRSIAAPAASAEGSASAGESLTDVLQGGRARQDGQAVPVVAPVADAARGSGLAAVSSKAAPSRAARVPAWRSLATRAGSGLALGLALGPIGHLGAMAWGLLITLPVVVPSLILHEMGHAKAALMLGDDTAARQGRLSFRPRDLLTHIDPWMTLVTPVVSLLTAGWVVGGARPVPFNSRNFSNPARDSALLALAGPGVNLALAAAGGVAFAALGAAGAPAILMSIAAAVVAINVTLAVFNLLPAYPFDGHHVARWLLPKLGLSSASRSLDRLYAQPGFLRWAPALVVYVLAMKSGLFGAAVGALEALFFGGAAAGGASLAAAALPAVAAAGMLLSVANAPSGPPALAPQAPAPASAATDGSAELIVVFKGAPRAMTQDMHLSFVDVSAPQGASLYSQTQRQMVAQLSRAGLSAAELSSYNATPIGTYQRINAATLRLDAAKADEFSAALRAKGFEVFPNKRRKIIIPVPVAPQDADPTARGPVTMDETLALTRADSVQKVALQRWGAPDGGNAASRLLRRLFGETPPQPKFAVIDSGIDAAHPLLKDVKAVNVTSGENKDDIGHGSWVTSMNLNYARWSKNYTHYKTFVDGGASTDDILKALTASANDGNLVISNSWGDDAGDPNGPDSQLVRKLAQEGHILVFAAGNAGPDPNTVGAPAIVYYKDAQTGALRVLSVAAADRRKKIAPFSSRGPGSPATKDQADYPQRPDLTAVGYNTEGAWPTYLNDSDRVDPQKGPVKAISGTSMSTPDVAGAIALLCMLFNVTSLGPRLDAVAKAVMDGVEKMKEAPDAAGAGFLDVEAAYNLLYKQFFPGKVPPTIRARYRRLMDEELSLRETLSSNRFGDAPDRDVRDGIAEDLFKLYAERAALVREYPALAGRGGAR